MNISQIKLTFPSPSCTLGTTMKYSSAPALQKIFRSRLGWNPPCNVCHIPKFLALHLTNTCWRGNRWWWTTAGPQRFSGSAVNSTDTGCYLQHFYRVARGSHRLCPAGGNQRRSGPKNNLPTGSTQGWGQHCAHVPGQIPAQKQPECPSWAELETTLVYLISQCNVVTSKPVVLMLSEEKHLSWDLYFKLLNILCTLCSIGRSIPPWAEYISISGFCQWRQEPSAKP